MLRNVSEIINYVLLAKDGEIGHVEDFAADDKTWDLRYVLVNTSNWSMLLAPNASSQL